MTARCGFGRATSTNPAAVNIDTVPGKSSAAGGFVRAAGSTAYASRTRAPCSRGEGRLAGWDHPEPFCGVFLQRDHGRTIPPRCDIRDI